MPGLSARERAAWEAHRRIEHGLTTLTRARFNETAVEELSAIAAALLVGRST
ncbi:hypothetical protein ACWCQK_40650 [Streptomyces sp. NPDC002306]